MARSVHIRRFVAVLLCCVLAFHSSLPVARAAEPVTASLTIAAGAMALGGLSAAAVESTIGPQVAAIIGTTMQGLGTSVYIAEDSALTKTKFIMSKIAVWCVQAKMAKEDFYKRVAQGVTVAANGTIQLTHDASKLISQFISSLYASDSVVSPEAVTGGNTVVNIGDLTLPFVSSLDIRSYSMQYYTMSEAVGIFAVKKNATYYYIYLVTNKPGVTVSWRVGSTSASLNGPYTIKNVNNGLYLFQTSMNSVDDASLRDASVSIPVYNTLAEVTGEFNKDWSVDDNPPYDEVFTGLPDTWEENKDLLNPAGDSVTTVTPDIINKLIDQLVDGQTATMDIATYLDSLVDAFDGLKAQVAELTDAVTGTKTNVAVPDSITTSVTVDPVNPISVPAVEPVELTPGGTIEGFSFPLDEIFPFCIPFDVVAALELFDVPAEAPSIHVHWELPYNIVFDFDLDLSSYDDIAELLRVMETILFAVGLAVATRSLYIRS